MFEKINTLPRDHPEFITSLHQFQNETCDKEKRHVWCCKDGRPKSEFSKFTFIFGGILRGFPGGFLQSSFIND